MPAVPPPRSPDNDPVFRRVLVISTALAFGGMLASLALFEDGPGGLLLRFHWAAVPLFLSGCLVAALFWRLVFRVALRGDAASGRRLRLMVAGLGLMAIAAFFYPLRFVSAEKRMDVLFGMGLAFVVLGLAMTMWWKVIRWLSADEPKDGET